MWEVPQFMWYLPQKLVDTEVGISLIYFTKIPQEKLHVTRSTRLRFYCFETQHFGKKIPV